MRRGEGGEAWGFVPCSNGKRTGAVVAVHEVGRQRGGGPHLFAHHAFGEAVVEQVAAELDVRGRRRPHAGMRVVVHLKRGEKRDERSGMRAVSWV